MSLLNKDGTKLQYQFPWALDPSRWEAMVRPALAKTRVKGAEDLAKLLGTTGGNSQEVKDYGNLLAAISELETGLKGFQFYDRLLPQLQRDLVSAPQILGDGCDVLFHECGQGKVQLTHYQAYLIACLAFFGLCHRLCDQYGDPTKKAKVRDRFGHLDWSNVYGRGSGSRSTQSPVAVARIKCQLAYLHTIASRDSPEDNTYVLFHRTVMGSMQKEEEEASRLTAEPVWSTSEIPISRLRVHISSDHKIEDVKSDAHVDFANKDLHIGEIIPSATQEEVLFSIRPECFVGLLFSERMEDNEAIVITGARRFADYTGYLKTFRYTGLYNHSVEEPDGPPAIIAMDSLVNNIEDNQFHLDRIVRDTKKAYLGFADGAFHSISTGQWGCGAFLGDPTLKFIQQVLAATQAGVRQLHFSAFRQPVLAEELRGVLNGLCQRNVTVGGLYRLLVGFESRNSRRGLPGAVYDFLLGYGNESKVDQFHRELKKLAGVPRGGGQLF